MRIDAIGTRWNAYFRGNESPGDNGNAGEKASSFDKVVESQAAVLPVKTSANRKTIPIELHNALVKLTAYRMALLFSALSGFAGYNVADKMSGRDTEGFANAVYSADIDTNANFEIKDVNYDGIADIVLQRRDSSKVVLDLKNSNILVETTGFKNVK